MSSRVRTTLVVALVLGAALWVTSARAGASTEGGCANIPASAIDQYCEMFPSGAGSQSSQAAGSTGSPTRAAAIRPAALPLSAKANPLGLAVPWLAGLAAVAATMFGLASERWRLGRRG
jgi:hypothetical protein